MNPETLLRNVQVRRSNSQNAYGVWLEAADAGVPDWVCDKIMDAICDEDADEGRVEQGGAVWVWRKN